MKKRLRLIIAAFCVSFLLMILLCLFSIERFETFVNYSDLVDHSNVVIGKLYKLEGHLKDVDRGERGYMLTRDTMYLRYLNNSIDSLYPTADTIRKLTRDNMLQQNNMVLLRSNIASRIQSSRNNIAYTFADTTHSLQPSKYYYEGRTEMLENSRILRMIHDSENKLLAKRFVKQQLYQELTLGNIRYLLIIFCLVTAGLFTMLVTELRKRLKYQEELHARIVDLKRSHSELEQIAYVASHDLQEPLRKIQVFGNRLLFIKNGDIDEDSRNTMERINISASRMQELIEDLVSLTSLTKNEKGKQTADLNFIARAVQSEFYDKIEERGATININPLPRLKGHPEQLQVLLRALFDNSLKFTREGVKPVIVISNEITNAHELRALNENLSGKKFNCITFSDNGMGFDNQFSEKMFQIFQRLHNQDSDYAGKGIGLAICQRVMANHEGYIIAHGEKNIGATFKLFFPIEE